MKTILTLHFPDSFYEIFLPGVDNRRFDAAVPLDISGTAGEISLPLEVWDGEWFLSGDDTVFLEGGDAERERIGLQRGQVIHARYRPEGLDFTIVVSENYPGYTTFDKYMLDREITIGKAPGNTVRYDQRFVSGPHGVIRHENGRWTAVDLNSKNGSYINGRRLSGSQPLQNGDIFYIFGLKILFMGDFIAINRPEEETVISGLTPYSPVYPPPKPVSEEGYFIRSPRRVEPLDTEPVEIEAPPAPQNSAKQPLLFTIGPAFTMVIPMAAGALFTLYSARSSGMGSSPFLFMGIITSVTAAFIGVFWALMNHRYARRREREAEQKRLELYRRYLKRMETLIVQKYSRNKQLLEMRYPPVAECLGWAGGGNRRLWERSSAHADFLMLRLGLGSLPSPSEVIVPKERFTMVDDALTQEPARLKSEYYYLQKAPVHVSLLENSCIGAVSRRPDGLCGLGRLLALGLSASHSYTEVKSVFIYPGRNAADWSFTTWLPHVWDGGVRLTACDKQSASEVLFHLTSVLRARTEEEQRGEGMRPLPHYVVFVADTSLVESEAVMKYLMNPQPQMGVTTVMLCESVDMLPNSCTVIMQDDEEYVGLYSVDGGIAVDGVAFDRVEKGEMERFARALSGIRVRELAGAGAVPQMLTFLELYKTSRLEDMGVWQRWLENRTFESMRALVGQRSGGEAFYLDIHEKFHGPHGLVAGTTGSGKSETLQAYILSLALNYHPSEVSFILIDYKGGGMAECFKGIPHLSGIITNLSGSQTMRALTSIKSEIMRRQKMLLDAGLNHIDGYIEQFRAGEVREPMPHLLIIADEFAELKKEQDEFVRELVSASRVGRSLGVHLILATQKPSGVVDDEIRSNARFRLCLRVQDKQDSKDMIDRNDAAYINNTGRAFFQVGNDELFEEFQTGWSGAPYEPDMPFTDNSKEGVAMINRWGRPYSLRAAKPKRAKSGKNTPTQLQAAVAYIGSLAEEKGIAVGRQIWMPPLPHVLPLQELTPTDGEPLSFTLGMVDDPTRQQQRAVTWNLLTTGHILISGSVGSGKTTLVQTMLYSLISANTPDALHLYIADYGSRTLGVFAELPHTGGVVYDNEPDKTNKLITLLISELERRKHLFSQRGVGSYREYRRVCGDVPALLFVLDNYAGFAEACPHHDDALIVLSREAASYGIYLLIASTGDLRSKIRQNISTAVGLQLADKFEYGEVLGERVEYLPEEGVAGRGLVRSPNVLEFQAALCVTDEDDTVSEQLRKAFREIRGNWHGAVAPVIPQVPQDMSYTAFAGYPAVCALREQGLLPYGYDLDSAQPVALDPSAYYCYLVGGHERSGKTGFLQVLLRECAQRPGDIAVIDGALGDLAAFAADCAHYIRTQDDLYDYLAQHLIPAFRERNAAKHAGENMSRFAPISIFIADLGQFCEMVYSSERDMKSFLEQAMIKGVGHGIAWYGAINPTDFGTHRATGLLRTFAGYKQGIHFGGQTDNQQIFSFELPFSERGKRTKPGIGLVEQDGNTRRVITPKMEGVAR